MSCTLNITPGQCSELRELFLSGIVTKIDSTKDQNHTAGHGDDLELIPELDLVLGRDLLSENVGDPVGLELVSNHLSQCREESDQGPVTRTEQTLCQIYTTLYYQVFSVEVK